MKERPILFSAPMVRAILDGSKTQTRRVMKPQPREASPGPGIRAALYRPGDFVWPDKVPGCSIISCKPHGPDGWAEENSPYGKPGDRLWVRESHWMDRRDTTLAVMNVDGFVVARNGHETGEKSNPKELSLNHFWKLRPSIHMPRWASRISLEITRVRVERLQDISEADAMAEGAQQTDGGWWTHDKSDPITGNDPIESYRRLWERINGPDSWTANPWVWVVQFRRAA